jgi:preprotein translocase subunit YajC
MTLLSILLQGGTAAKGFDWSLLLMMSSLFVVFYFFMIRPQQKKAKEAKKFRESLQKGSKVVTIGGLHGKVVEVNDKTILIEADTNVRLRFEKSAVAMDSTQQLTEEVAKAN